MVVFLTLNMSKSFGVIRCIFRKLGCNSKTAHHRAKRTKICAPLVHVGIFDLEHVKLIWGHSVQFSENWPVTQKRLIVERNGRKFGPLGVYVCMLVLWCIGVSELLRGCLGDEGETRRVTLPQRSAWNELHPKPENGRWEPLCVGSAAQLPRHC